MYLYWELRCTDALSVLWSVWVNKCNLSIKSNFNLGSVLEGQQYDTVAERLRRPTRNRLGLSRVGSSPAGVDVFVRGVLLTRTADPKWRWWYYADCFQVVVYQKQWRVFAFESYTYCCTVCIAWLYIVSSTVCDLKKIRRSLVAKFPSRNLLVHSTVD